MIIEIPGDPIPKARHRYCVRDGHVVSYDPQSEAKQATRTILEARMAEALNHDDKKIVMEASNLSRGKVFQVTLNFYLPLLKTSSMAERSRNLWYGDCTTKPDIDNLVKYYLDCANGILWPDDRQIVCLNATKYYSQNPKTVIRIIGTNHMTLHESVNGILGIFQPDEFDQLTHDVEEGYANFVKMVMENLGEDQGDFRFISCTAAAMLLSMLADKYADKLAKIRKKYPGLWQEWPNICKKKNDFLSQETK